MATLHLINRNLSPDDELLTHIQHSLSANDALLFLAEGIYSTCFHLLTNYKLYLLDNESSFRPLVNARISFIDYVQFVQLGVKYERSLSWA